MTPSALIRRCKRRSLREGHRGILRQFSHVSFAVKNGAHCGKLQPSGKVVLKESHSPSKTALIAGSIGYASPACGESLIRRQKRRSLRVVTMRAAHCHPFVSFAVKNGAHCGWDADCEGGLFTTSHSPPQAALIAERPSATTAPTAPVSFAATSGAHSPTGQIYRAILRPHFIIYKF